MRIQTLVTDQNCVKINKLMVKCGFQDTNGALHTTGEHHVYPYLCVDTEQAYFGGNLKLDNKTYKLLSEKEFMDAIDGKPHQRATFTEIEAILSRPLKNDIQTRAVKVLTEEAQDARDAFIAKYGERGNCSCYISPPCSSCTHEGNPRNQEEDDEAWTIIQETILATPKEEIQPMQQTSNATDFPLANSTEDVLVPCEYTVAQVFGFPSQIKIKGYTPGHPLVPTMDHTYVWEPKMAKDMIEWLNEDNPDPLWVHGPTGCIAGDARLRYVVRKDGKLVNKKGGTMANLFKRWNLNVAGPFDFFIQSVDDDGVVFLNNITAVIDSGIKDVFLVTTETGKQVKATADHKFLTSNGYKELRDLSSGNTVMTAPRIAQKQRQEPRVTAYRKETFVKYHPTAKTKVVNGCTYYRVRDTRIAFEAALNMMTPGEYVTVLNGAPKAQIDAMSILPADINIHHIDENPHNNDPLNLQLMSHAEHALHHQNGGPKRYAEEEQIVSIIYIGKEQVYDISVTDPVRNFVVEDFVVHNCGKTCMLKAVFSALNIPTVMVSAKASTEPDDILGRVQLRGGDTIFVPGELLKAYERGYAIIFDEIDGYNPEVGMAIHRLLERETILLDDGTVIKPAARNLIAATANTRGDGQGGDVYAATKSFNLATMNRFEKWEMGYPAADVEENILKNAFGTSLDDTLVKAMVKTAGDIRRAYADGSCPGPISIRDMLRWGRKLKQSWNRKDVSPTYHAFDKAFANGVEPHVKQMLHTLVQANFGTAAPAIEGLV